MKRIVTIGGGSGQFELLRFFKIHDVSISAVVSMMDDGGSTGRLRSEFGVLPPGDIRRCLIALAQEHKNVADILEYRFEKGDLRGHTVGNILLAAFQLRSGNFQAGIDALAEWLHVKGQVLPVTFDAATLCARLEDGTVVEGETNIDIPKHNPDTKIESVYLIGDPKANPEAVSAIRAADLIVLTIGDIYTSVIPNLLVPEISEAIKQSSAPVVYTCNQKTKRGETDNFTASDYISTFEHYLHPGRINYIIVNRANSSVQNSVVVQYDRVRLEQQGIRVIEAETANADNEVDGKKLAAALFNVCQQL